MDEKEKKELIGRILNVDNDPKMARVGMTVFISKASQADAVIFLNYLEHSDPAIRKMARQILAQKGVTEAIPKLMDEFYDVVSKLTFMPDAEYTEANYYANLVEIMEALFALLRNSNTKDDKFFDRIFEIFKRTKNEDLRFSLIKLIGILGDHFDYFMKYFDDLTEKERKALYFVYSIVEYERRVELFKRGLQDEKNFDYVITSLLGFEDGKKFLADELLSMSNYSKQIVLKKLQDAKYPEFNETLIKLLSDKNKFLVELSIDILKNNISGGASMDPFIKMVEEGYSPEGIQGSLEIIHHFVKKNPEDIYISGLEKQPSHKNKNIILEFLMEKLKKEIKITEELTDKIVPKLLGFFDTYTKEKEELFISIFKIVATLRYSSVGKVKGIKKKITEFAKEWEQRSTKAFKNNMNEFIVKLNHMIARFDEAEAKKKNIKILFDLDVLKIEHERMLRMRDQVREMDYLDESTTKAMVTFLSNMVSTPKVDWKVKTVALDLIGEYGGVQELPVLANLAENETSLAVKTNAQKALKRIEELHADDIHSVLIMEPLPYLQKMLNEFFKTRAFKVFNLKEFGKFDEISEKSFKYVVVSENIMSPEFSQQLFDYIDEWFDSILIILTAKPESMATYAGLPNVKLLKKPFNNESLAEVVDEY